MFFGHCVFSFCRELKRELWYEQLYNGEKTEYIHKTVCGLMKMWQREIIILFDFL